MKKGLFMFMGLFTLVGCSNSVNSVEYGENFKAASEEIMDYGVEVEAVLKDYIDVWNYSISKSSAISVSEMSTATGLDESSVKEYFELNNANNINSDFSENVLAMKSYHETSGKLSNTEEMTSDFDEKLDNLQNPPDGYAEAYNELELLYASVTDFAELAHTPGGTLQDFTKEKDDLAKEVVNNYESINEMLPDEEEE